jgi:hypothetical protein
MRFSYALGGEMEGAVRARERERERKASGYGTLSLSLEMKSDKNVRFGFVL